MTDHRGPWRYPDEESVDLYPGLVVCDGRVSGSITLGRSRLPLWCFVPMIPAHGWSEAEHSYDLASLDYTPEALAHFLGDLLEMRGEFGRLLLVLADAERCERQRTADKPWWATKRHRKRVADQLRRCLATLEDDQ